jgi:hypothetical protein
MVSCRQGDKKKLIDPLSAAAVSRKFKVQTHAGAPLIAKRAAS